SVRDVLAASVFRQLADGRQRPPQRVACEAGRPPVTPPCSDDGSIWPSLSVDHARDSPTRRRPGHPRLCRRGRHKGESRIAGQSESPHRCYTVPRPHELTFANGSSVAYSLKHRIDIFAELYGLARTPLAVPINAAVNDGLDRWITRASRRLDQVARE